MNRSFAARLNFSDGWQHGLPAYETLLALDQYPGKLGPPGFDPAEADAPLVGLIIGQSAL